MKAWRFTWLGELILLLLLTGAMENPALAQAQMGPSADLSLGEAVKLALEKHPALRAASHQAAAAATGIDQARAGFLPRVDFSEGITRSNNPVYAFGSLLNQGRFTQADFAVDTLNHPDPISNWRTNIGGSVPLFVGGRNLLGYQQAQISHEAAERGRARTEQEIIYGVVRAYYAILLSQEARTTVDASVRTAEANLAAAQARYESGVVVASDALAARVRLARLKQEAIAAANQVALDRAALNDAIGVDLDQSYRITGSLDLSPVRYERLEGMEALAKEQRPDYRQAVLEEQRLEKEVLRTKGALLPTLHLMGNYEINNHQFASQGQDSWSVGMVMNLNLFSGGLDRARIVEAQANRERAAALREKLASVIGLEVRDAYLGLQTARERVAVAKDAVTSAEESLRIVQDRYESGLTTIVELLDSEMALTAARTSLTRTLYDATVGQARLDLSLGTIDPMRF
ncbi:MAG TPA: TolC family protein [Candidatus Methylomirabilis sp.]|nr:TolC family protein [Candidatus Methylomirabilis sp.]